MLIGHDFPKMEFQLFGLDLLEPNALIWNWVLSFLAFYFAYKIYKEEPRQSFTYYWTGFFLLFGTGLFFGGLGHSLWNYWGAEGKIIPFSLSIISIYLMERGMICLHQSSRIRTALILGSKIKLVAALIILGVVFLTVDVQSNLPKGFAVPGINATLGLLFSLLFLPLYYRSKGYGNFQYFLWSVAVLLPSTIFQLLKINLHPWMDRNDVAHILMLLAFIFYYQGIKKYNQKINDYS